MDKESRYTLVPGLEYWQRGGFPAEFHYIPEISSTLFNTWFIPVYGYILQGGKYPPVKGTASLQGFSLGTEIDFGLSTIIQKIRLSLGAGGYASGRLERVTDTTPPVLPAIIYGYGLRGTLRADFNLKHVSPWIKYSVSFLEHEQCLTSSYHFSKEVRHTFFVGLTFNFSLIIFG